GGGGGARRADPRAARADAEARRARRVRVVGVEPQAAAGVDHPVRPGAAEYLSRHGGGVRIRSRGAGAERRGIAARGGRGARAVGAAVLLSTAGTRGVHGGAGGGGGGAAAAGRRGARGAARLLRVFAEVCAPALRHHRALRAVSV